ncbi:peptidase M24 [Methanocaldococcus vulcanius M7]|uniref:Peptidase M24 n=1 Tax=Methanocaldococcus vulcanius (strain ATCC 700851 / DSM 12094 / M7) TaxID=579137 RepID=C9RFY3_METVM|nr:M24 family metallopeptidase [Methanocaldococcus vulcanius]ACX72485.1 peptidase M24 [Methanocaldococcus vulcanius M7]
MNNRISRFLKYMENEGIKKVVVLKKENINYFLGKYFTSFSALVFEDQAYLYVGNLDKDYAEELFNFLEVREFKSWRDLFNGCDGVEEYLPITYLKYLKKDYKIISKKIKEMRMIKDSEEVKNIEKAAKISDKAIEWIYKNLDEVRKMTEIDVVAEIEYIMKKHGSIKPAFDSIVISGRKTSFPHALPTNDRINDILLVDIGAVYNGYCSDITRTFLLENKNTEYKNRDSNLNIEKTYELVYEAKRYAEEHLKDGISARSLDCMVREFFGEYKDLFIHSLGHGVGLEVHEEPRISCRVSDKEDVILKEGMIITIEPGLYLKDHFGVRIEDLYLVKKQGFKKLSSAKIPKY